MLSKTRSIFDIESRILYVLYSGLNGILICSEKK